MDGYAGRILSLDLTRERTKVKQLGKAFALLHVGGKGFGAAILSKEVEPRTDPLSPANKLIFATGPVNGLALSGAAKLCAVFKSPLTGIWGESQCGGYFAPQMKFAGYDVIAVEGTSKKPVYALIEDDNIRLLDASHLWGKDAFETEEIIKKDYDRGLQVLSIGPAGENLVRFACITHDKGRQFGRCGGGAVMGSKNLKAVAVKGSAVIEAARLEEFDEFREQLLAKIRDRLKSLTEYGTAPLMSVTNTTGTLPTRNWTEGEFEGFQKISAEALKKSYYKSRKACYGCAVACRKISKVECGQYAKTEVDGPEYETLFAFGSLCANENLESIIKANEICDRLGMDTISAGNAIAFGMECYEKGILTLKDTKGVGLKFGNYEAIIEMLNQIACRRDFGDVLAEGVKKASETIGKGSEKFAVHAKGLEPPGYDPRGLKGVALSFAVSQRGACHLRHMIYRPNLTGKHPFKEGVIHRLRYEGQARILVEQEAFYTLVDSMVLCKFVCLPTVGPILWDGLKELYQIVTGIPITKNRLLKAADRINNLVRTFNERESGGNIDVLPSRFMCEALNKGASEGETIQKSEFNRMLGEYYDLHNHRYSALITSQTD